VKIPLRYAIRNLIRRRAATVMTAAGIALVTAVFVAALGLVAGLHEALALTGNPLHVMALRQGARAETYSAVTREQYAVLRSLPQLERDGSGAPLATAEAIYLLNLVRRGEGAEGRNANVTVRGVSPHAFAMRPQVRVVAGRCFAPGADELIVGVPLLERFGVAPGGTLRIGRRDWAIVGAFDAAGTAFGSEIWCDVERLLPEIGREVYSSVTLRARDKGAVDSLVRIIEDDPRLKLHATTEPRYYADQAEETAGLLYYGLALSGLLAIGGCLGAMNTMYASVSGRAREIATIRALGFPRRAILLCFLAESALLALPGAALGSLLGLAVNGVSTGTTNFASFSEVAFSFEVGPLSLVCGFAFGVALGVAGGLVPAAQAAAAPLSRALREV